MFGFIKSIVDRIKIKVCIHQNRILLKQRTCSIISQNCIGGVFLHDMNMEFKSPTINLFFSAKDFVRFVNNLEWYLEKTPQMKMNDTGVYPIGILDDIEIHFLHYTTCEEAKNTWEKRKKRVVLDKIVVLMTDRDGFDDTVFNEWKKIDYPKLLFTSQKCFGKEVDSVYFPEYEAEGMVPDLIPTRKFYREKKVTKLVNTLKK